MELPVERWYKSIFERHSRRRFTGEAISEDVLEQIEQVSNEFQQIPGARSALVRTPPDNIYKGAVGQYGAVKGAPHFVAFIGDMSNPNAQEAVGYHGEAVILEATSLGVKTCWIAGYYRPENVEKYIELEKGEQVLGITPLGYTFDTKTRVEQAMTRLIGAHRRKEINQILHLGSEEPTGWVYRGIDAARVAPSAVNRQPWRFKVDGDSVTVFVKDKRGKKISPRLDCGIAMLHFEVGAKKYGADGSWKFQNKGNAVARYDLMKNQN
ncbi:MAG: nitroreductase family protein [Candidatus Thorarchaeota archaeon]|jgi:nitroreductase